MSIVSLQEAMDFMNIQAEYFEITAGNDGMVFTSSSGGPVTIDIPDGTYEGAALATALQTAMNANNTLTGTGTITFAVSWNSTTRKFTIDAGTGKTIAYTHSGSDAGSTLGFDANHSAAQTITSDNACANPTAIVEVIRDSVEKWVQTSLCRRNFESQSYSEYYSGRNNRHLFLKQYPITAITRLAVGCIDVIQVYNTAEYTSATVAVTSTGLVLTKDGVADSTILFATYTTISTVAAAINALGSGWYALVTATAYDSFASTELIEQFGMSCIDSTAIYLKIPDKALGDFTVMPDRGEIFRSAGWPSGYKNIRVDYTAGYAAADMPDDLEIAIKIIIKYIYQKRMEETFGLKGYSIEGLQATFEGVSANGDQSLSMDIPKEAARMLGYYARHRV